MNVPFARERRQRLEDARERVEAAAIRQPRPPEPPPRAADNPFDAASAELAARWDRMKADCEAATATAQLTHEENLHLRERVRSLEAMLDQQSTTYEKLLEHHTIRGDEAVQALADLKTRFTLIRDTLSAVLADPALVGARPEKPAPQPRQAAIEIHHQPEIGEDYVTTFDKSVMVPPRPEPIPMTMSTELPPEEGISSLIHRLAPVSLVR